MHYTRTCSFRGMAGFTMKIYHLFVTTNVLHYLQQAATVTAILSFFPGRFTRMTPLATFKELLTEGRLPDYWSSGSINSECSPFPNSVCVFFSSLTSCTFSSAVANFDMSTSRSESQMFRKTAHLFLLTDFYKRIRVHIRPQY